MWFDPYKVFMYAVKHPKKAQKHDEIREKIRVLRQLKEEYRRGTKIKKERVVQFGLIESLTPWYISNYKNGK